MSDVKRLLDEATTGPWMYQHVPDKSYSGEYYIWGAPSAVSVGDVVTRPDAKLIVYAVNRLPDYEAAVDALERLIGLIDSWDDSTINRRLSPRVDDARAVLARLREPVPA